MTTRSWEAAETHRLNRAHWQNAKDTDINCWLREQLPTLRARSYYETRNSGMLAGVATTLVDDVVGPDGPMFEIHSSDEAYNKAGEEVFREWFKAPTFRKTVSGAALLKLWVRNLPRAGEILAVIGTDPTAEGPVQLRLRPVNPRRLESPNGIDSDRMKMGIEFDQNDCPTRYWISESRGRYGKEHIPYSPDDIVHEFVLDEEGQARGFPWLTPALSTAADLRDYDFDVGQAARHAARTNGMLYTEHPDAPVWNSPESMHVEPGEIPMAPIGWKPMVFPASQPCAQYPDYRGERMRDFGRSINMPLMMIRLDSSKHSYSSSRFDGQGYYITIDGIQCWLSGTPESYGLLSRLADLVLAEARFKVAALRRRPADAIYVWTWPRRPHVDPTKEKDAQIAGLEAGTDNLIDILSANGTTLQRHLRSIQRVLKAYKDAGLPLPAWANGTLGAATAEARAARAARPQESPANAQ